MTLTLFTTPGPVGPGFTIYYGTSVGVTAIDDIYSAQIVPVGHTGNFFCAGSTFARGYVSGAITFGIHEWSGGSSGKLDTAIAPGDPVEIDLYLTHADGFTDVDTVITVSGFTWDPVNGVYQLVSDRGSTSLGYGYSGGALARIEAAVIRTFP